MLVINVVLPALPVTYAIINEFRLSKNQIKCKRFFNYMPALMIFCSAIVLRKESSAV